MLPIDGRPRLVWVVATVRSLYVYVRFLSDAAPLFVDAKRLIAIPINRDHSTLTVIVPTAETMRDADNPFLWRFRPSGRFVATVDVYIKPITD